MGYDCRRLLTCPKGRCSFICASQERMGDSNKMGKRGDERGVC